MANILVVEDDVRMAQLLKRGLSESGHEVGLASDLGDGLRAFANGTFDVVISDVVLPTGSGFELCRQIRQSGACIPVLMLTALGTTDDKLNGFDSGADDYLVKPFDFRELLARVNAILKRRIDGRPVAVPIEIRYADLKINTRTKSVYRGNAQILLTPKEYNLLLFFAQNPERVLSRSEIAEKVWDTHFDTGTNFIDVYINYLRKKIDKNFPVRLIHTKPGMGFMFSEKY
ncbi:MAG: response regulator transcription factor [Breznakibacter sp.]